MNYSSSRFENTAIETAHDAYLADDRGADFDLDDSLSTANLTATLTRSDGDRLVLGLEFDEDGLVDGYTYSAYSAGDDEPAFTDGGDDLDVLAAQLTDWLAH